MTRRGLTWILLAVLLVATGALVAGRRDSGRPLDPTSARPLGTLALVTLLDELGADVDIVTGAPRPEHDVALLLADRLDAEATAAVERWTRQGGTLVVTDPMSPFAPRLLGTMISDSPQGEVPPRCELPAVSAVRAVKPVAAVSYELAPGATGCFPFASGYIVVAAPEGAGSVVAVAGAGMWVNAQIGESDNAVLAASLLAPRPGTRVAVVEPPAPGTGGQGALSLVPERASVSLWQLVVAFFLFAVARGRRLTPLHAEATARSLPGSVLVEAVANLMQTAGHRQRAADALRAHARRDVADRLGTSADAATLVPAVVQRNGLDAGTVERALAGPPPADDAELVAVARSLEQIRSEVVDAR